MRHLFYSKKVSISQPKCIKIACFLKKNLLIFKVQLFLVKSQDNVPAYDD